ncbi:transcription factor grauzone [Ceratitis capitata]|uniref:transcription factor grauzone n=1 Tax=Ceratitis capitata TaxID=7213 RepID=UPI000618946C|nr:transcription factor grauzone [Ceratitis capitata]
MICRLCLIESNDVLKIYTDEGEMAERDILKIVARHFQIEIRYDDAVSNMICLKCWGSISDFHKYWLSIEEKQKTLNSHLEYTQIKRDIDEVETEVSNFEINFLNQNKLDVELGDPEIAAGDFGNNCLNQNKVDEELCEQEIDMNIGSAVINDVETVFIAAKIEQNDEESEIDNDVFASSLDDIDNLSKETAEAEETIRQKRKYTKRSKISEKSSSETQKRKRGRPRLSEAPKKKKDIKENKTSYRKSYQETLKSIEESDKFLADNTQLSCSICGEHLKDFRELKTHFRQKHQCIGYTVCCDLRFYKRTLYVDHIKLHKDPDYFKCSICNKQLISRKNFANHMHSLHPAEENLLFECTQCSKKFSKQYILDSHIKIRHSAKDQICKLCDKAFSSVSILRQHQKNVHLNEFESVCDICGKRLRNPANLQYHMDNIHNTEPRPEVECTLCHKWLKSERSLRKHMISHRDVESGTIFKCSQCGVEKKSRHSLSSHIRYHHSNRIFPCTVCTKEFKTPIALKEHEATHTGVDLYTCPFCPKTFRSHANMHKHKLHSHSDEWVRKYAQPNEYTQSLLNKSRNTET